MKIFLNKVGNIANKKNICHLKKKFSFLFEGFKSFFEEHELINRRYKV